jgi:succinate dehydrogenase/fumarate reductase flavoprotein subunit
LFKILKRREEMAKRTQKVMETDILLVGSEGAGSRAAIEIAKNNLRVLVATKGIYTRCGATLTADMDMDVPSRAIKEVFGFPGGVLEDDEESFCNDMFEEGKYMNNEEIVWAHVNNSTQYVKELIDWGMKIEGYKQSPGHRYPRGLLSTGRSMMEALKREVKRHKIDFIENTMVTNILTKDGRAVGAVGVHLPTGDFIIMKAKAVILATGGAMRVYPVTTAPQELTGDGMIMALDAGAELVDMEFPMFLPACLYWPESMKGADVSYITSSAIGGWWYNAFGERFIAKWDSVRMEYGTTRDVASIAQAMEIIEGRGTPHGGIWVSYKHLPDELIEAWFNAVPFLRNFVYGSFDLVKFNMDPRKVAYEAGPAAHYWNGGIRINAKGETGVPGLFAGGEVQGGTMGANRLSGNAVTECVVFGGLAGIHASQYAKTAPPPEVDNVQVDRYYEWIYRPLTRKDGPDTVEIRKEIQELAFKYVGPIREESGLTSCLQEIEKMKKDVVPNVFSKAKGKVYNREWFEALEIEFMVRILEIVARASLMRKESRGAMYRKDYPETDNKDWLKNVIVSSKDGKLRLEARPVVTSRVKTPAPEKVSYMVPTWKFSRKA